MKYRTTTLGATLAGVAMIGSLAVPGVAEASKEGRKNTAIGLGAAAAHQLLTGKTENALLLGAGAAYAYKRYKDSEKDEKRQTVNQRRNTTYRSGSAYGAANRKSFGGTYVYTGRLEKDTDLVNRRVMVDHNGILRRTSVPKDAKIIYAGDTLSVHDLKEGDLVRVTAVQTGENQWNAKKIEVLNAVENDVRVRNDAQARARVGAASRTDARTPTYERDRYQPENRQVARYNGVGVVESVDRSGRIFHVKVGTNVRRVFVDDSGFTGVRDASDLRVGDRVRVIGTLEDRDVIASEVTLVE